MTLQDRSLCVCWRYVVLTLGNAGPEKELYVFILARNKRISSIAHLVRVQRCRICEASEVELEGLCRDN